MTVCDQAKETCPFFPGKKVFHKGFDDTSNRDGSDEEIYSAFRETRDQIRTWIQTVFGTGKI